MIFFKQVYINAINLSIKGHLHGTICNTRCVVSAFWIRFF